MSNDRKRRRNRFAAAAAIVLVFAGTWLALDRTEGRPGWITVEGPDRAAVGERIAYRVTLKKAAAGELLDCTLHHANAERKGWGYLASSGPPLPAVAGKTYTFTFTVPEHEDSALVFALIFLSPTGKWPEGRRAVSTMYVPIVREAAADPSPRLRRTRVYRYPTAAESDRMRAREPRLPGRPSVWVRPVIGALLLAAALAALGAGLLARQDTSAHRSGEGAAWLVFAVLLAAAGVAELSGIATHLAEWGRRLAEQRGVYEQRQPFQKTIMAATAAASLGLFFLFMRAVSRPGPRRFLWWAGIGLAAYLAVSLVSALSFHAMDVVRGHVWHGLSLIDVLRGAGALVALAAAALAVRQKSRRPAI